MRGVREGLTEGQFYERKGGAERRFFACAGRAVSNMGQGAAGSAISRERDCLERGREERVRMVKIFFRVSPSARYLEAIFGSARD